MIFTGEWGVMKAEIVAVGTELLLGQIVNTNARYLSERLASLGIDVYYHSVVGDNAGRLKEVLVLAMKRSDIVIITGGLGPTQDDLTKETVAALIGKQLIIDEVELRKIEVFFGKRQLSMPENNRKQALIIQGGIPLANDFGTAPGIAVKEANCHFILLPGPPREMQPMFEARVIPYLKNLLPQTVIHSKVLKFYGIGESALEEKVMGVITAQGNPTVAPLVKDGEVHLRLTAKAETVEKASDLISKTEHVIRQIAGRYLFGMDGDSLQGVVMKLLTDRKETVGSAESCTGGLVSHLLSTIPGSSKGFKGGIVSYTNEVKELVLGVPTEIIKESGAVSSETAQAMAEQIRHNTDSTYGVSVTGVAGPDTAEGKDVGTVFIGLAHPQGTHVYPLKLSGDREEIQLRSAKYALYYLWERLKEGVKKS